MSVVLDLSELEVSQTFKRLLQLSPIDNVSILDGTGSFIGNLGGGGGSGSITSSYAINAGSANYANVSLTSSYSFYSSYADACENSEYSLTSSYSNYAVTCSYFQTEATGWGNISGPILRGDIDTTRITTAELVMMFAALVQDLKKNGILND